MKQACIVYTNPDDNLSCGLPAFFKKYLGVKLGKFCFFGSVILLLFACHRKNPSDYIIPRDKFKDILIDFHLIDGFYTSNYNTFFFQKDTANFYTDVLKEYGCNLTQFDSTYRYYTRNLKQFDLLYEEVITELNKMQEQSFRLIEMGGDSLRNMYHGKKAWKLPKDGPLEKIPFSIKLKDSAKYSITVYLKVFSDDETEKPKLTAFFTYDNGTKEGGKDYFTETSYHVSRRFVVYTFSKMAPNKKVKNLSGFILDHSNTSKKFKKHIEVKGIYISKN